jgi:hypothetical protein
MLLFWVVTQSGLLGRSNVSGEHTASIFEHEVWVCYNWEDQHRHLHRCNYKCQTYKLFLTYQFFGFVSTGALAQPLAVYINASLFARGRFLKYPANRDFAKTGLNTSWKKYDKVQRFAKQTLFSNFCVITN